MVFALFQLFAINNIVLVIRIENLPFRFTFIIKGTRFIADIIIGNFNVFIVPEFIKSYFLCLNDNASCDKVIKIGTSCNNKKQRLNSYENFK